MYPSAWFQIHLKLKRNHIKPQYLKTGKINYKLCSLELKGVGGGDAVWVQTEFNSIQKLAWWCNIFIIIRKLLEWRRVQVQGCALAEPVRPWRLTFALRWLENLRFFIQIICWAPSQFQSTGFPSIFLRAQPWGCCLNICREPKTLNP